MNKKNITFNEHKIHRPDFLYLIDSAFNCRNYSFIRQATSFWLEYFTGDLLVKYLNGKASLFEKKYAMAKQVLTDILEIDPEYADAYDLLARINSSERNAQLYDSLGCAWALGKNYSARINFPDWCIALKKAVEKYEEKEFDESEKKIHEVLALRPDIPLAAIIHLKISSMKDDALTLLQLAQIYHTRWPRCVQFKLHIAEAKMKLGEEADAVNTLHECVADDTTGRIAARMWGKSHSFQAIWPDSFELSFNIPIPADVAALVGKNFLVAGESVLGDEKDSISGSGFSKQINDEKTFSDMEESYIENINSEDINLEVKNSSSVKEVFNRLAEKLKSPEIAQSDGRFPVYVILSTKTGLAKKYGRQSASVIDKELRDLENIINRRDGWRGLLFYPDEASSVSAIGMNQIDSIDPWKLKLALHDLEKVLNGRGEMIGALLIVGGSDVVPFHRLPNPTDDSDSEVLSDNPYSTLDGNYFVPEWPVGRLPGDAGSDTGLLLEQIRNVINEQLNRITPQPWWMLLLKLLTLGLFSNERPQIKSGGRSSMGYTAAVWKNSSAASFKPVHGMKDLLISPPSQSGNFRRGILTESMAAFFNLHGMPDTAEWFGQKIAGDPNFSEDYPIALTPRDITNNGRSPLVIFTEACYGAFVEGKTEENSVALKFLGINTPAFIGSTCIAYGSVAEPLIGADLLAHLFWKKILEGKPVGQALCLAKIEFVKEMEKKQGFLDGEDQKTLLSFVLYGDPLFEPAKSKSSEKSVLRQTSHPPIMTMEDGESLNQDEKTLPKETLIEVKQLVEKYLPGINHTKVSLKHVELYENSGEFAGDGKPAQKKVMGIDSNGNMVMTIAKEVQESNFVHRRYARLKFNSQGKLMKLAISK